MPEMLQDRSILFSLMAMTCATVLCAAVVADTAGQDEPAQQAQEQVEGQAAESSAAAQDDEGKEQRAQQRQRIVLRVNRNQTEMGYLELEDADVIVIRTTRDEVKSYPKVRVLQIVRLVDPEPGQTGTVILTNGQRRSGVVIEDTFEHVLIEIEGIPTKLQREFVNHVVLEPTFEQRYQQYVAGLRPHMTDQHVALCRWLIQQRRYDLAKEHLTEILAEHDHYEAQQLLRVVDAQLALQEEAQVGRTREAREEDAEEQVRKPARLLTHDEVNLIRVYEVDFDHPPRMFVSPSTVRRIFETYGTHEAVPATPAERNAMLRGDAANIVRLMFELRARELYPEIQVRSEPHSMNMFRLRVHDTWLLNNCATSGCHGGPNAGDLYLHRASYANERARYTNFLILERLAVDPEWPLINYENPEMSLIIQYGLPRDLARLPHPEVRGWAPIFGRPNDRMKDETIRWINAMMRPRPAYPIEFDPRPQEPE